VGEDRRPAEEDTNVSAGKEVERRGGGMRDKEKNKECNGGEIREGISKRISIQESIANSTQINITNHIYNTYLGWARDMPSKILGHSGRPKWVLVWRPVMASLSSPSRSMIAKAWLSLQPRVR